MISVGDTAAEHRPTCRIALIVLEYSCPDVLDPMEEVYPGPASKPRKGNLRRIEWNARNLSLNARAPVSGADVNALGDEIGRAIALQMFRDPLATMLLALR